VEYRFDTYPEFSYSLSRHFGEYPFKQRCRFTADLRVIIATAECGNNAELSGAPGWQPATERTYSEKIHRGFIASCLIWQQDCRIVEKGAQHGCAW